MAIIRGGKAPKRNFTSLIALSLSVLMLCQLFGTTLGADRGMANKYAALSSRDIALAPGARARETAVIVGDGLAAAEEAFGYLRMDCTRVADAQAAPEDCDIMVISGAALENANALAVAEAVAARGGILVVSELPSEQSLAINPRLRKLLGVRKVRDSAKRVYGARLFAGLLLGGELNYYEIIDEMMSVTLLAGFKVYMLGMDDQKNVDAEAPVIWRYAPEVGGYVFVVNADFLEKRACAGLITAMYCQTRISTVYPVINSQLLCVLGAPNYSIENRAEVRARYAMDSDAFLRNTLFAYLLAAANTLGWKLTWAYTLALGDDYERSDISQMDEYLRQIIRNDGELAWWGRDAETLARDIAAFEPSTYEVAAIIADLPGLDSTEDTVLARKGEDIAPLSALEGGAISLPETHDSAEMGDMDNFTLRCVQTALAYSAATIDVGRAIYPESDYDDWVEMGDRIGKNIYANWHPFQKFERVTLSEAGYRARNFIEIEYEVTYSTDKIIITIQDFDGEEWLMLRTEDYYVRDIDGGDSTRIEKGAYLIRAEESVVEIELGLWHYLKYY